VTIFVSQQQYDTFVSNADKCLAHNSPKRPDAPCICGGGCWGRIFTYDVILSAAQLNAEFDEIIDTLYHWPTCDCTKAKERNI
jgi:hypothetical protein